VRQGRALGHDGAGGSPAEFRRCPAMRCSREGPRSKAVGWWNHFGVTGRKKLTRRMSSTVRCGRSEGNGGWGDVRRWWSTAHGAGRLYTATRCSGRGRIGQRRPERAVHGGLAVVGTAEQWGAKGGGERKGAPRWGWAPFKAARGSGRRAAQRQNSGQENGGGSRCLIAVGAVSAP
jgi:hypothetical protein